MVHFVGFEVETFSDELHTGFVVAVAAAIGMLKLPKPKVVVGKLIRKLQTKPSLMPWDRTLDVHIWSFVVVVESAVAIVAVVAAVVEAAIVVVEDIVVEESAANVKSIFSF